MMNLRLKKLNPNDQYEYYRLVGKILQLRSGTDPSAAILPDINMLLNRCYYVQADHHIIGVVLMQYYRDNEDIILGIDTNSVPIRQEHYRIEELLLDDFVYWDSQHVNMFEVANTLIREVCADTNDKMVVVDVSAQINRNMSNNREMLQQLIVNALARNGFCPWAYNVDVWFRFYAMTQLSGNYDPRLYPYPIV